MRKSRLLWLVFLVLFLVGGALLVPSVAWQVYGRLHGEAFYKGMPTSYWSGQCRNYYVEFYEHGGRANWRYQRRPSWADQLLSYCGVTASSDTDPLLNENDPLLKPDLEAIPVLVELLKTGDPQSQLVAAYVLEWIGMRAGAPELPMEKVQYALQAAVPALQEAARSDDKDVRKNMLSALWTIDPKVAFQTEKTLDWNLP